MDDTIKYYNVQYVEPDGLIGTHYAVCANNEYDAARKSALECAILTNTNPMDWRILHVGETDPDMFTPN